MLKKRQKRTGDTAQGMSFSPDQGYLRIQNFGINIFTDSIGRGDNPAGGAGDYRNADTSVGPHERRPGIIIFADRL